MLGDRRVYPGSTPHDGPSAPRVPDPAVARAELADAAQAAMAESAYVAISRSIATGELESRRVLHPGELAAQLELDPLAVGEAFRRLERVGLIDSTDGRLRVAAQSIPDLRELYQARLLLEPAATHRAAELFTDEDAALARDALARHVAAYESGSAEETFHWHTEFHFAIYRAAHSRRLERLIEPLWESSQRYRMTLPPRFRRRLQGRLAEHERILTACVGHHPEQAANELHAHLANTANLVAARFGLDDFLFSPVRHASGGGQPG